MLYDKGERTPEQVKAFKKSMSVRAASLLDGTFPGGCIDSAICEGCNHLIVDSLCLCSQSFTCPNCGYKNGPIITTISNTWPTLQGRLSQPITTEKEALEQLEKSVPLSEEGKKRLKELLGGK